MSRHNYHYQCCDKICTLLDHVAFTVRNAYGWEYKICSPECLLAWATLVQTETALTEANPLDTIVVPSGFLHA